MIGRFRFCIVILTTLVGVVTSIPCVSAEPSDTLSYTFELLPGAPPSVRVILQVRGETDGESRLAVAPDWGGVQDCARFVHELRVFDDQGRDCRVTTDDAAPHGWNVSHEPGASLTISYELRTIDPSPLSDHHTQYEPVIDTGLFHLIGETGLVYPEWLEDRGDLAIQLAWAGFAENGWRTASSFDDDDGIAVTSMPEFRHAVFLAGPHLRVYDRDLHGSALRVAICGDDWEFTDSAMVASVEKVIGIERTFFDDFSDPFFLVTVVPVGPRVSPNSIAMGGTGLTNCFALFIAPGTSLEPGSVHRTELLHLLAHEYFHHWNGAGEGIAMAEPEELVYWLSEGFTDFYASRLLLRAGLIRLSDWLAGTNKSIRELWTSPVATAPATTIQNEFWSDRSVHDLPYNRGEAVAIVLDQAIRDASDRERSLDDFMRAVLRDTRSGPAVTNDSLLARIARWTSPELATTLKQVVVDGGLPRLPMKLSEPPVHLEQAYTYVFDPGFNIDGSIQAGEAVDVRAGSAAFEAGLRNDQTLIGYSVHYGDTDQRIKLKAVQDKDTLTIEYLPRGDSTLIPVYRD